MLGSKPTKQPRMMDQSQVVRTESVNLLNAMEERDHPTSISTQTSTQPMETKKPSHPKGHKVRELKDVWGMMDKQAYLHLTDSLTLGDIWIQPQSVDETSVAYGNANVEFLEIILAPHIKQRVSSTKINIDDLLKMLYLGDRIRWASENVDVIGYDAWLSIKTADFIKVYGVGESGNRAKLCNFIIKEDKDYTFYPDHMQGCYGMFFRKICYHSYKGEKGEKKYDNPTMIKCCGTRSSFEYMLEARWILLPNEWITNILSKK